MSEKPKAGEWWECSIRTRKFIVGENAYGRIVTQSHGGGLYSESCFEKWSDWRRLDGCTGFDWKASLPADLVTQDRVAPRAGIDEILIPGIGQVCWTPVHRTDVITIKHGQTVGDFGPLHVRCRRKDLPALPEPVKEIVLVKLRKYIEPNGRGDFMFLREDTERKSNGYTPVNEWVEIEVPVER